jgi:hypothetical protein
MVDWLLDRMVFGEILVWQILLQYENTKEKQNGGDLKPATDIFCDFLPFLES